MGAVVLDNLTGKEHSVHARTVINAAGPFSDEVRHLSQVSWSSGPGTGTWAYICICPARGLGLSVHCDS